jgi:hypothetical protein
MSLTAGPKPVVFVRELLDGEHARDRISSFAAVAEVKRLLLFREACAFEQGAAFPGTVLSSSSRDGAARVSPCRGQRLWRRRGPLCRPDAAPLAPFSWSELSVLEVPGSYRHEHGPARGFRLGFRVGCPSDALSLSCGGENPGRHAAPIRAPASGEQRHAAGSSIVAPGRKRTHEIAVARRTSAHRVDIDVHTKDKRRSAAWLQQDLLVLWTHRQDVQGASLAEVGAGRDCA